MATTQEQWAAYRAEDMANVQDRWWERLAHIRNGRIGDGVHVAYEWAQGSLIRAYIGHEAIGPCLQYDVRGRFYTGDTHLGHLPLWYNCYSRGNYGRKYANGGNWSGHCKGLHPRIMQRQIRTTDAPAVDWTPDGSVQMIEVDCSPGWSICYHTAAAAWADRLTLAEIQEAQLPIVTKQHMGSRQTEDVMGCIRDVIQAYNL